MNKDTDYMLGTLSRAGIIPVHAVALRRVAMTLHNWHERECGTDSGCITRDEDTGKAMWLSGRTGESWRIPDLEKGALRRLDAIMNQYPDLSYYIQGDPRGAPLYILRKGDIPEGKDVDAYYSRGLAVYK